MFIGLAVNGTIIGNMIAIITNAEGESASIQRKKDKLAELLVTHQGPNSTVQLMQASQRYFDYLMTEAGQLASIEKTAFDDLPHSILHQINLQCKFGLLRTCPFFDSCADEVLQGLVQRMRPSLYAPGDSIIYFGDMGKEMYFVERGMVEVVDRTGTTVFATLGKGAFFGETALFFKSPRMATIRALNMCSLYTLEKGDFDKELALHEYDIQAMVAVFTELQAKNKDRNAAIAANLKSARQPMSKLFRLIDERESVSSVMQGLRERFKPMTKFRFVWNSLGLMALLFYAIKIPYDAAFVFGAWTRAIYLVMNFLVDFYWVLDIALRCSIFSEEDDTGKVSTEGATIQYRYVNEGYFYLDCVASTPLEVFALAAPAENRMVVLYWTRIIHLVRLHHVGTYLNSTKAYLSYFCELRMSSTSSLLVKATLLYVLSNHILACSFFACHRYYESDSELTYVIADGYAEFDPNSGTHNVCSKHIFDCYTRSFYFVLATISAVGYGDIAAQTNIEACLEILTALVGACVTATICGAFGAILEEVDAAGDNAFQQKMRDVARFCRHKRLDEQLRGVVFAFYRNMWQRERRFDQSSSLIEILSKPLQMEVQYAVNGKAMLKIPIFSRLSRVLMMRLAGALKPQLFSSGFSIYHEGQEGVATFFVSGGIFETIQGTRASDRSISMEIVRALAKSKDAKCGRTVKAGGHFGEASLSSRSGARIDSARAVTDGELYVMERNMLWDILQFMQWWERRDMLVGLFCSSNGVTHTDFPCGPPSDPPTPEESATMQNFVTAKYLHRLIQYVLEEVAVYNNIIDSKKRVTSSFYESSRVQHRRSTLRQTSLGPGGQAMARPSLIDMQRNSTAAIAEAEDSSTSSEDENTRDSFTRKEQTVGNRRDRKGSDTSITSVPGSDDGSSSNPNSRRPSTVLDTANLSDLGTPTRRSSNVSMGSEDMHSSGDEQHLGLGQVSFVANIPVHSRTTSMEEEELEAADVNAHPGRRNSNPQPLGAAVLDTVLERDRGSPTTVPSTVVGAAGKGEAAATE